MTRILRSLLLLLLAGALAVPALAQTSTATIRGKVLNDQNAALAGAQITAVGTTGLRTVHANTTVGTPLSATCSAIARDDATGLHSSPSTRRSSRF